jgi:hypothetical protein
VRSPLHSSSSLECAKRKAYNDKMQFAQMIIRNIYRTGTFVVEFLHKSRRSWHAKERTRLKATLVDLVFIEESEEDEAVEQHFAEAQTVQTNTREENIIEAKVEPSTEV